MAASGPPRTAEREADAGQAPDDREGVVMCVLAISMRDDAAAATGDVRASSRRAYQNGQARRAGAAGTGAYTG
jgi:hypothetical protein